MNKVYLLSGPSGAGKSSFAGRLLREGSIYDPITVVSSDTIREELFGDESIQGDHGRVFDVAHEMLRDCLSRGISVIVDATNLKPEWRSEYLAIALQFKTPVHLKVFQTSPDECKARQKKRDRQVPHHVIDRQCKQQREDLSRSLQDFILEGFTTIEFVRS